MNINTTATWGYTTSLMRVLLVLIRWTLLFSIILVVLRMVNGTTTHLQLDQPIQQWLNRAMPEVSLKIQSYILFIPMLYQRLLL